MARILTTGLGLTMTQILQHWKNKHLVILALLGNFVLVPALTYLITTVLSLDESLKIGLIILFTVAGAPFLVREVQAAKGDFALTVGLMFMLMADQCAHPAGKS